MVRTPALTIVIPTYNSAATLRQTLDSIREAREVEVEVVVIDGASDDRTMEIVDSFGDLVSYASSEPDQGIYDAINKGLARARGDLIGVVGSDDVLVQGSLRTILRTWETSGQPDIVAGRALMVELDGATQYRADEEYGVGALLSGIPFCHNAMFATRQTYLAVGQYDTSYKICADAHWVHRAIRSGRTCTYTEQPIVRFSLGGTSSREAEKIMEETYKVIAANFEGLSVEDAERLFKAVRGWSDGGEVPDVLSRNRHNPDILISASMAFLARSRRNPPPINAKQSASWRNLIRRFRAALISS
ncbi:glycosyltransferase family 2 protein [Niveibacterium sp. SC-1]|uniref:glycosyltransferase family 2 protein n=1 Tax=Niveibacterium sp. SC-1 TaxID=3135646 RepID=UPI00311E48BF